MEEIRSDPEKGARRLEAEFRAGLHTLARRLCRDNGDAAELVNRTFAEVISNIDSYAEQSAFFAWMSKILVNLNANDIRGKRNGILVYPGEVPDIPDERAENDIYREVDASFVRDAIEKLPEEEREVLLLHYYADIPIAKMAKILAVPVGTVKSRLHYARKALAAKLGAKAEEMAKKPGAKAVLLALLLCGLTALGAAVWNLAGSGEAQNHATATQPSTFQPSTFQPSTFNESQGDNMSITSRTAALGAATALALAAAPPAATADYQFIIGGDPEYDQAAAQSISPTTALAVAPRHDATAPDALEARGRTIAVSPANGFRSDANSGFTIIVR